MQIRRFTLPAVGAATAALGLVALSAGAASAHVTVTPDTTAAGGYAVLTFAVPHGCEGSPTTKIAIAMPEEVPQVTPTVNPGWTVEKVQEKLDPPVEDAHGNTVTERVSQVVYTARTPLPDGYRDTLALSLQLPEKEGETLTFPIVQTCVKGSTSWNETAAEGQDEEELAHPAPSVTITAASAEGDHHGGAEAESESDGDKGSDAKADSEADSDDGDGDGLAIGGLVAGLGGLALGGVALARTRKA